MGNGPKARLPDRLCSFSDMGRMPHSERASPSSGTAAPRILPHPQPGKTLRQAGKARGRRNREANHTLSRHTPEGQPPSSARRPTASSHIPARKNPRGKRAKPADAAAGRPALHPLSHHTPEGQPPSSGTAAPRILPHPQPGKNLRQAGKARKAAAGRPALHPLSQTAPRHLRYASTTINSFVSSAVCTSSSIFSSRFFSCLRITFRFGLVTGCFATKMVQQSS